MVTLYTLQIVKQLKQKSEFLTYAVDASYIVAHFCQHVTFSLFVWMCAATFLPCKKCAMAYKRLKNTAL